MREVAIGKLDHFLVRVEEKGDTRVLDQILPKLVLVYTPCVAENHVSKERLQCLGQITH